MRLETSAAPRGSVTLQALDVLRVRVPLHGQLQRRPGGRRRCAGRRWPPVGSPRRRARGFDAMLLPLCALKVTSGVHRPELVRALEAEVELRLERSLVAADQRHREAAHRQVGHVRDRRADVLAADDLRRDLDLDVDAAAQVGDQPRQVRHARLLHGVHVARQAACPRTTRSRRACPSWSPAGRRSAALCASVQIVVKAGRFGPISNGSVTPLPRIARLAGLLRDGHVERRLCAFTGAALVDPTDIAKVGANGSLSQSVGVYESEGPATKPGWS